MSSTREFDTVWRSLIPAALILCAGLVAYLSTAAGEFGPLVVFGRADANATMPGAWVQLPLHAGLALLMVIGRPRGLLWLAWATARLGLILLVLWAASLTLLVISDTAFIGAGWWGILGIVVLLLALYGAALYLTLEDGAGRASELF